MRRSASLLIVAAVACGPSVQLGPLVTCPNVIVANNAGECDLVTTNNQVCSDQQTYEINCGDDGTCTCVINGVIDGSPVFVSDQTSGFCATLTVSMYHSIAAMCLQPGTTGENLNLEAGS